MQHHQAYVPPHLAPTKCASGGQDRHMSEANRPDHLVALLAKTLPQTSFSLCLM